jgi:hypothetical protein
MSKARDLANAGTALTTVSATELGYLDGVTSAVQTQINAKQATVSGVNDTEIGYLDGVTSAIQTQINAQIPKSTVTTKGDILVATGSGTIVRQGVGTDGQVLVADSAQADGVNWATPSAGGMTLISEQVLSASTGYSFTSIPQTYKQLVLIWGGIKHSANSTIFSIRLNANSGSVYEMITAGLDGTTAQASTTARTDISAPNQGSFGSWSLATANDAQAVQGILMVDNYASTTKEKSFTSTYGYFHSNNTVANTAQINGNFASTTAVTSIDITRISGTATISNVTNTTVRLYGVS